MKISKDNYYKRYKAKKNYYNTFRIIKYIKGNKKKTENKKTKNKKYKMKLMKK